MLDLRSELQGIRDAHREQQLLRLLCDAISGEVEANHLDAPTTLELFELAEKHGVVGLFPSLHPSAMPMTMMARARNLRALRFTRRVVDVIESAGIRVVVLKGAAAAARWADPTLRQQTDVDVLVEKKDKAAVATALIDAGLCSTRIVDSDHMHNDSLAPAEPSGLMVEVHHYFNNHHPAEVPVGELLARRQRIRTPQGDLPTLAPEDDAVFLAVHATTHALTRLAWLVDLIYLPASWPEAAERARQWNLALAVAPAWERARSLLRVPIPESAFHALRLSRLHMTLAAAVLAGADHSRGETHRLFERSYRLSVVPLLALPRVLSQKLKARVEEQGGFNRYRAAG